MKRKTNVKSAYLVLAGGALLLAGCIIPDKSANQPQVAPGSAASLGGGTAAAAPAAAAGPQVGKDCGPNGLIDDGEDGNNQNLPNDNRGGYWYTFKDHGTTTVDPTAGEEGGTFAMSEGGHDSQYAARFHGTVGSGSVVFSGMGTNLIDPKDAYDASKYAGISFWAKKGSAESTGKVRLKVPDVNTDPQGGVCTECFNDFGGEHEPDDGVEAVLVPLGEDEAGAGLGRAAQAAHHPRQALRRPVPGQSPPRQLRHLRR